MAQLGYSMGREKILHAAGLTAPQKLGNLLL
jgi:hypothetical protein